MPIEPVPPRSAAPHATWAEIDLGIIQSNVRFLARTAAVPLMAVVKAEGYGHGAVPVARAALHAGAAWCGVARAQEALALRHAGIGSPVLLLGLAPLESLPELITSSVTLTVWSRVQVEAIASAAGTLGRRAHIHLKVDTGMSRLGVQPEEAVDMARSITERRELSLEGVFTHFARADEADPAPTAAQEALLQQAVTAIRSAGLRPGLVHAANSAATLTRPSARFDLVRVGIALYGLPPAEGFKLPSELRPALTWRSVLTQVKRLPAGRGVSYGHAYVTRGEERIGTVAVGYGDGFRRTDGNVVLVGDATVPVVGRVCMDQVLVQLDGAPDARQGDEVVLIGSQGASKLPAAEVARRWGTIPYEVVCGIAARVPRLYL